MRPLPGRGVVVVAAAPVRVGADRRICSEHSRSARRCAGAGHATTNSRATRSGSSTAHSSARMPPIEPPTTHAQRSMPSASASARSTATWSRIVIIGKRGPYGRPSGAVDAGRSCPGSRRARSGTRRTAVGVERPARPDHAVPPPGVAVAGARRAGGVAVAGERVQHEHRVRAVGRERAPRLVRDRTPGSPPPASSGSGSAERARTGGARAGPPWRHAPVTGGERRLDERSRHAALAARNPASRSARMSSRSRCRPTAARGRA